MILILLTKAINKMEFSFELLENITRIILLTESSILFYYFIKYTKEEAKRIKAYNDKYNIM
jgi:hypothetical protein